jgi:hypothetical protein
MQAFNMLEGYVNTIQRVVNYHNEVLNGVVTKINQDGSYNVTIRSSGTEIMGVSCVGRKSTSGYPIGAVVCLTRKENARDLYEIHSYSGYSIATTTETVDIGHI